MQSPDFRFKQFSIWHDQCAMKVNTDGILLGAWTELKTEKNIADIGTGTGLIALMLAQKAEQQTLGSKFTAIEIDQAAAEQAKFNVAQSNWGNDIEVTCQSFQSFDMENTTKFDLLVSNPPYFSDSLQAPDKSRNLARHNQGLSFQDLLMHSKEISTSRATFNLILPCNEATKLLQLAKQYDWHLSHHCKVATVTGKAATRSLISLSRQIPPACLESELTIRNKDNSYHSGFIALCKDYYLFM